MNNLRMCKNLTKHVDSGNFPPLDQFPMYSQVSISNYFFCMIHLFIIFPLLVIYSLFVPFIIYWLFATCACIIRKTYRHIISWLFITQGIIPSECISWLGPTSSNMPRECSLAHGSRSSAMDEIIFLTHTHTRQYDEHECHQHMRGGVYTHICMSACAQVTYRYYVGRLELFDGEYQKASDALTYAFDKCTRKSRKNKR